MTHFFSRLALVFGLVLVFAAQAPAVQAQVNPTQQAVSEDALFNALGAGDAVSGRISIPDANARFLIKPENKSWAAFQGATLHFVSIGAIVGMIGILLAFFLIRGRIRVEKGLSGRLIPRLTWIERFAHWTMASTFIVLALTGLNIVIGKSFILPLIGESAFGTMTAWGKMGHNFLAWAFMVALLLVVLVWIMDNMPKQADLEWLKQGGGLFSKGVHPPAWKYNAGQKIVFWLIVAGGGVLSYTGFMLLFPAQAGAFTDWQFYQTVHALTAAGLTAVIIAHIYIGSIGLEGAFEPMRSGGMDENFAKEHHPLWVAELDEKKAGSAARPHPAE